MFNFWAHVNVYKLQDKCPGGKVGLVGLGEAIQAKAQLTVTATTH